MRIKEWGEGGRREGEGEVDDCELYYTHKRRGYL